MQPITVMVNDCPIAVTLAGEGPPVLLLHGYPETRLTWRHTIAALAPHFRVIAPDLRGWGDSAARPPFTLPQLVADARGLLAALDVPRASVVGHDWGAAAAYILAHRHPEVVERLVTVNMPVRRFVKSRPLHFYFFAAPLVADVVLRAAPRAFTRAILRWWAHDFAAAFPPEVLDAYLAAAARPGQAAVTLGYYRATLRAALVRRSSPGPRHRPAAPAPPWRVLWGGDDPVSPAQNIRWFQEDLPGVPVDVIPGAGHFPQEERPAEFNARLLAFLRGNVDRPGP